MICNLVKLDYVQEWSPDPNMPYIPNLELENSKEKDFERAQVPGKENKRESDLKKIKSL